MTSTCRRFTPLAAASAWLVTISRTTLDSLPPMPAAAFASLLLRVSDAFTSTTWKPNSLHANISGKCFSVKPSAFMMLTGVVVIGQLSPPPPCTQTATTMHSKHSMLVCAPTMLSMK
jgi:hypothetical protein